MGASGDALSGVAVLFITTTTTIEESKRALQARSKGSGGGLLNCISLYPACTLMYPEKYMFFTYPSVSWGVHMYPVDVIRN